MINNFFYESKHRAIFVEELDVLQLYLWLGSLWEADLGSIPELIWN